MGSSYWFNHELLKDQRKYVENAVFLAGSYFSETDVNYLRFVDKFRISTSASPGLMAIYGYNIMNLIVTGVEKGHTSGRSIAEYMDRIENFSGLGGNISFSGNNKVNKAVNILQFTEGNIIKVEQ